MSAALIQEALDAAARAADELVEAVSSVTTHLEEAGADNLLEMGEPIKGRIEEWAETIRTKAGNFEALGL